MYSTPIANVQPCAEIVINSPPWPNHCRDNFGVWYLHDSVGCGVNHGTQLSWVFERFDENSKRKFRRTGNHDQKQNIGVPLALPETRKKMLNMNEWHLMPHPWLLHSKGTNKTKTGSLENATCVRETNQAKINTWRGKSGLFSRFSSVSCFHWVVLHQMKLIGEWCGTQSGPSPRAKWSLCSAWPKWKIEFWPRTLQAERDFSGTSHQSRSYLCNISTNWWCIVCWQHRLCSLLVTEQVFKITLYKKNAPTPNFQNSKFSTVCKAAKADFHV